LFALARRTGCLLHVGHVERFNGAVQELRKIVEGPLLIESRRLGPFVPRVQKDTVVMDLMIHDLDIVLALVDARPRRLTAFGSAVHSDVADVANVQIWFDSGTIATITASRATEEKIRTLAITQPDAYIVLDYLVQDIQIHRRAAQESQPNRESIRYRQASFVEHLFVHKDNPLKLEILHLVGAVRRARSGAPLALATDLRPRVARTTPSRLREFGPLLTALKDEGVSAAVLVGRFSMTDVLHTRTSTADETALSLQGRAGSRIDSRLVDAIIALFAGVGVGVLDQRRFLGDLVPEAGCWSRRAPTADEWTEIRRGLARARGIADAPIGRP